MKQNDINDRFINAFSEIQKLETFSTKGYFAKEMGISPQTFSDILKKRVNVSMEIMKRISELYDVRYEYIFEGVFPIFKGDLPISKDVFQTDETLRTVKISSPKSGGRNLIPFYDVDFAAGNISFFDDPSSSKVTYRMDIPDFSGCIAFRIYGDSMLPLISSGSMVFATKVDNWIEHLEYGRVYGVVCQDGHKYVKYIKRHKTKNNDYFVLHSENNFYDDFDLKKSAIRNVWLIHGWVMKVV